MKIMCLTLLCCLALWGPGLCQTANTRTLAKGENSPPATIDQVSWLVGNWLGEGFGDLSEETWAPPRAGSMIGLFRQHSKGEPMFYEFLLVRETEGSLELRLKHFNPDIVGWEEKDEFVTFKLVAIEPTAAYFSGLTYHLEGDVLKIYLAMRGEGGEVKEVSFTLERRD